MGRLAQSFAGLLIQDMIPYNVPSEQTVTTGQQGQAFPNADLLNSEGHPFAVHRMIIRILALDSEGLVLATQPDIEVRETLVKFRFVLQGFNQPATKAPVRIGNLLGGTTSERYWRYEEPFVLPNSYGVLATIDCDAFPATFAASGIITLRVTINLQGYNLIVEKPNG